MWSHCGLCGAPLSQSVFSTENQSHTRCRAVATRGCTRCAAGCPLITVRWLPHHVISHRNNAALTCDKPAWCAMANPSLKDPRLFCTWPESIVLHDFKPQPKMPPKTKPAPPKPTPMPKVSGICSVCGSSRTCGTCRPNR